MARSPRASSPKPRRRAAAAAAVPAAAHVVYVHGICPHQAGYSDGWWDAMKPYVPDIPEENRHEVLWSDVIAPAAAAAAVPHAQRLVAAAQTLLVAAAGLPEPAVSQQIKDILADRAQRQLLEAAVRTARPEADAALAAAAPHPFLTRETAAARALVTIPGLECVEDFAKYLIDNDTRNQVIARFTDVVQPLLAAGSRVEIISHSWGTVVAYEGLRWLDAAADLPDPLVHNLFTVGSALSIAPVKRSLLPEAIDGQRPRLVQTWVNLDARFDIVGGHLQGNPFAVDDEYLDLPPVGCSLLIPNPACAHESYFVPDNLAVNRDIFGKYIQG